MRTITTKGPGGIEASRDPVAPLAELCGFLLAAMRWRERRCDAGGWPLRCLIVDDNRRSSRRRERCSSERA